VGLTIEVVGQAAKRGIIPRQPTPDRLLADAQEWIGREHGQAVRWMRRDRTPAAYVELAVDLHPAAGPVTIAADATGRVLASADVAAVGPGYHTFVARLFERLGANLGIVWLEDAGAERPSDVVAGDHARGQARYQLLEREDVERAHLTGLGQSLGRVLELRRGGETGIQIGLRPGTRFSSDGAIVTPLGPRDDDWLDRAARDAKIARDIRPWWVDAMDARYHLHRALCIMWTEIRWRPPTDDAEVATFDEALRHLRRALPMDPSLPYPWREWQEMISLRGVSDPIEHRVTPRAEQADASQAPVGYRRRPVTVVQEGWRLEVPGDFSERRTAEEWRGRDRGRAVTLAGGAIGTEQDPMPAETFLARVAAGLGDSVLTHRDGELLGTARIGTDASSGIEVAVLEGYAAVPGRGAAIRIVFDEATDWQWAVKLWRSLRPA
jgi:hypothetical protein